MRLGFFSVFSSSIVRRIMATESAGLSVALERPRRRTDFSASASRPFRTSHQGDSGARKRRMARGVGNIHWRAMGTLGLLLAWCSSNGAAGPHEPVCRVGGFGLVVIGNATNNDRTNSPEHLQHLSGRSSQSQWHNLSTVGGSVGDENAPGDAFEQ